MKKLHTLAFYAMVTPVMTFAASSVLAQTVGQDIDREQEITQRTDQSNTATTQTNQSTTRDRSNPTTAQTGQSSSRIGQPDPTAAQTGQSTTRTGQSNPTAGQTGQSSSRIGQSNSTAGQSGQSTRSTGQPGEPTVAERLNAGDKPEMHRGYLNVAPARGMQVSNLVGAEVSTSGDEDVGSVDEVIIDENGQIVAIVVGVGGFLGMAEKDVAIGWGHVTRSGTADDHELRIDVTREDLRSAPEFARPE